MAEKKEFTKYERARIIGARGLQISMDAPLLMKMDEEELNGVNYDPLRIAEKELDSGVLPISVNKPMPKRVEEDVKKLKIDDKGISDAEKIKREKEEEEIAKEQGLVQDSDSEEERHESEEAVEENLSKGEEELSGSNLSGDSEEELD